MLADEVIGAEMQRDRVLVRFEVFAVAEALSLKPLQFLANAQKDALDVRSREVF